MSGAGFILAINMSVAGLLAALFLLVAMYDRVYVSARWVAAAFGVGVVYSILEFAIREFPDSRIIGIGSYSAFLVALALFNIGLARKYNIEPPWRLLGAIVLASAALNLFVQDMPRDSFLRMTLFQGPYAALSAVGIYVLSQVRGREWYDTTLGVLCGFSSLQFLAKPFIAQLSGGAGDSPRTYLETTYALISQTLGTVMFVAVALTLLSIYVSSMLTDAAVRSETDPLSGLLNRRGFEERAETILSAMIKTRVPVSLVICDLDHFKSVNDTYGHAVGDRVIVAFATILRDVSGGDHAVGRIGGEEFALIMPGANRQTARLVAEGVRVAFADATIEGAPYGKKFTASFGAAEWLTGSTYGDLLRRADLALYQAKHDGRDCVRVASNVILPVAEESQQDARRRVLRDL